MEQITLDTSLVNIGLNKRALHPLLAGGYHTVKDVLSVKVGELLKCPNMGPFWITDVIEKLRINGFELESMVPEYDASHVKQSSVDVITDGVSIKGEFLATGLKPGQTLNISISIKE